MYESDDKMVSHPSHYQSETGLEVIDVIEAFTFDLKGIEATDTGNIIKYSGKIHVMLPEISLNMPAVGRRKTAFRI